jgi:ribosomal protein L32
MPEEVEGQTKGVFTLYDPDMISINDIEQAKRTIMLNINNIDEIALIDQLKDLFGYMQTTLQKYFSIEEIKKQKVVAPDNKAYDFYELKAILPQAIKNKDLIRIICELAYTDYNLLIKKIGVAIPTMHINPKKKLILNLFSVEKKYDPDAFVNKYLLGYKNVGCIDTNLNFLCYLESQAYKLDLDIHTLEVGATRTGKSTLFFQRTRRGRAFREGFKTLREADRYLIDHNFATENVAYTDSQNLRVMLKNKDQDFLSAEEGYLLADRREALYAKNIKLTQDINAYASKDHVFTTQIQNSIDLEVRFVNKANIFILLTERGKGMVFCKSNNFPIIKASFGFERFIKYPNLLNFQDIGERNLMMLHSYIFTIHWNTLDDCQNCGHRQHRDRICDYCNCKNYEVENAFFETYLKAKANWQSNT